jgi:hypothetical protein
MYPHTILYVSVLILQYVCPHYYYKCVLLLLYTELILLCVLTLLCVPSYYYIFVLTTTTNASSYYYIPYSYCYVSSHFSVCPHTTVCVLILHMCPHTTIFVLILLYMCPHTTMCQPARLKASYTRSLRPHTLVASGLIH